MLPADASELVTRLVQDDPTALEDVYTQHAARCNAIAFGILGDDDQSRDVVQEAFLTLWRHRHGLVIRTAGIGPWLTVVTRNAALAVVRSAGARSRREERAEKGKVVAAAPDPADLVSASADASDVRSAIASLSSEQRTVVELAYFRFKTMSEIAETTDTPLGTVKRRAQL